MLWNIVTTLLGGGLSIAKGWSERKKVKLEGELELAKAVTVAKIKQLETQQQADIRWENLSIANSSWKDEWFTVILSIPAIMCFVPMLAPFVVTGFAALATCPEWYKWAFMVAVGSSFGYKKICDFLSFKKGA